MNLPTINVAIDIDDFLTSMDISGVRAGQPLDPVHYREENFFVIEFNHGEHEYKVENVLVPGCIPFFQFLFEHPQVRPAFFSAGVRVRNLVLAEKIVRMAVAAGGDPTWLERYDVFSREDCFNTEVVRHEGTWARDSPYQPPGYFGNLKKDLRMIHYGREVYHELFSQARCGEPVLLPDAVKDKPMLEHVILIEEDHSYLFPGQQRNMLLSPTYRCARARVENYQYEDTPEVDGADFRNDFKHYNTIFYAAGVMHHLFERYKSGVSSIPDILWEAQGYLWENRELPYKNRFPLHFFTTGRTVLRKYNTALNFAVVATDDGK